MTVFNWAKWVAENPEHEIAQIVLDWLVKGNYDDSVWAARDSLVHLVLEDRQRQNQVSLSYVAPDIDYS